MKIMFIITMITSSLFSISSSSWFNIWLGMEINVMSFIPLMMSYNHMKNSDSMLIYFLIQSLASMNLLFFILILNLCHSWLIFLNTFFHMNMIINLMLLMKMGAAPFYFWYPKVIKELTWLSAFMLMTWQKIIPLILIKFYFNKFIIILSVIMSVISSSLLGFNQTNMKLIMSFSSINHLGWMMTSLMMNTNIWMIYYMNYMMLNYILCLMFNLMNIKNLMNIFLNNQPYLYKITLLINFLSLSGLPPFLGFFPKWLIIMNLMFMKNYILMLILIFTTLINLFFYLRMLITSLMLSYTQLKWMMTLNMNITYNIMYIFSFLSSISLILITIIMNFV
nr:NADH dehydrogenase subunit 2 [Athripsodes cinereus]